MHAVCVDQQPEWAAASADLAGVLQEEVVELAAARELESDVTGSLRLLGDGSAWRLAGCVRAAIGVLLAREHLLRHSPADRASLLALDRLLQPAIEPRRRHRPTFPSRRTSDELVHHRVDPEAVARLIGLPLERAISDATALGLRLSLNEPAMNRSARQLDVVADADDRFVMTVVGLHV